MSKVTLLAIISGDEKAPRFLPFESAGFSSFPLHWASGIGLRKYAASDESVQTKNRKVLCACLRKWSKVGCECANKTAQKLKIDAFKGPYGARNR